MYKVNLTVILSPNDTVEDMLDGKKLLKPKSDINKRIREIIEGYIQGTMDNFEDELADEIERELQEEGYIE